MENRRQGSPANDFPWYALGALALLVLLWACRRALLGVPAADDYDYLYALRFQHFDFFSSMGSNFYWRPLGRQVYYAALQPFFWNAPWVVTLVHATFLFALFVVVFRVARRAVPEPVAACAAAFPLLAEPIRTLLVWPTGGEYLMAMLASALAVHEALARRWWTAGVAALAALLCHEASALVLLAMAAIAWRKRTLRAGLVTCAVVAALWIAGRLVAQSHGAGWIDRGTRAGSLPLQWLEAGFRVVMSQLNLEELAAGPHTLIALGYGLVVLATVALFAVERRSQAKLAAPGVVGGAIWLAIGAVPLALLAQWDSWRSPFPALWLGLVVIGIPGLARSWLAYVMLAIRTLALVLAPTAAAIVTLEPPPSASGMSFVRVARLQRTADATRTALLAHDPTLPRGAVIAYWSRLGVTEVALLPPKAPRVWYGDSTITWQWLWRPGGVDARHDAVLSFDPQTAQPVVVIEPATMALVQAAMGAADHGQARVADSLLVASMKAQAAHPSGQHAVWVLRNRARIAYQAGVYDVADRMNQAGFEMIGPTPEYFGMAALIAVKKGQPAAARQMALQALALEPDNPLARQAQAELNGSAP
jgi:hypothetical protein